METMEQALEEKMLQQADQFIQKAIPPEGIDTFGTPERGGFFGFGEMDLEEEGSNAFAGMLSAMDLDDIGTSAFGAMDLDDMGTSAFGGMGELGRWGFRRLRTRIRSLAKSKAGMARKALRRASLSRGGFLRKSRNLLQKARRTGNPFYRQKYLKAAKIAARQAQVAKGEASKFAKEAVNPKISRAMAREAMKPVVKQMAKAAARPARAQIKKLGKVAKMPGGSARIARAKRTGALRANVQQAMKQGMMKSLVGRRAGGRWARMMQRLRSRLPAARAMARGRGLFARARRGVAARLPFRSRAGAARSLRSRFGLRGLGAGDELEMAIAREVESVGLTGGVGQFLLPGPGEDVLPVLDGLGEGTSSYMVMGDMDTVSQEPEVMDITQAWSSDDIYGEPLGF